MNWLEFSYLLPLFIIGCGAVILMLLSPVERLSMENFSVLTFVFLTMALIGNLYYFGELRTSFPLANIFSNMIIDDSYAVYFDSILLSGGVVTSLIGTHYFQTKRKFKKEFFSLFLFSLFGMMLLVHANELLTAFIGLEIASLSLYVMIGFQKFDTRRVEASYQYLVLGSISGVFFLLGTALIYAGTGTTMLGEIGYAVDAQVGKDTSLVLIGGTFILMTFLFKISAFPFHNWTLDVYDGSPLPVTAFMAATFKVAIFGFILRIMLVDLDPIREMWDKLFVFIIIATLMYGSFMAVIQKSLKRMLAASSIVHTGYLLIAFVSIGVAGESASSSIIYYLVAYFLSAMGAFGLISYITSNDQLRVTYEDFRGFAHIHPYMAAMLSIFMLSLAGLPGTIGFIGKFYIFTGAIEAGYTVLAVVGVTATFVSIYYYFKLIALMYFYPYSDLENVPPLRGITPITIGFIAIAVIAGGLGNTFIAYFPGVDFLIDNARLSYMSLFIK
ncbi:MAG: NADH-quinone oxidoreductase subunit N [Sulfurospirillaceae bacterium]|nr:NADH-quinone oxidoreductase subunit N [Sulfurospirillaceae bacterium]MDD2827508.1 NADH-quinone oxidoreductase subunit N [Sulfurospirillaceae bacterium]